MRNNLEIIFVSRINEVIENGLEMLVANPPPPLLVDDSRSKRQADVEPVAARQA
jgi:hypothetical protein